MGEVRKVRSAEDVETVRALVWEFFDVLKKRYPDMAWEIDEYIAHQDVAGELEAFPEHFLPPSGECFAAVEHGEIVGIVMLKPHGETDGEMNRMYVRDRARGRGYGRALGQAIVAEAQRLGYQTLWLDALYRHVEALPLYESLGFRRYTDPDAFGGDDARIVHMKLKL